VEPSANVYAFDAATGKVQWRMEFEGGVITTPLLAGKSVIAGSATGRVARIDLESGKASWNVAPDGARSSMPRIPAPAADAKRVYFASNDPRLYALDLATGAVLWKTDLAARVDTSLVLHGDALYAGGTDNHLYAFDPASGEVRQRIALGGKPMGTLVVAPPLVLTLVLGKPHKLVAVDTTTHKVRWERAAEREWSTMKPLVSDGAVIAGTEAKDLCAFALADGAERWCTTLPQVPRGLGEAEGMLYVGTLNGRVMAFRKNAE
jgi:outer membrane protein assembly factor BamB